MYGSLLTSVPVEMTFNDLRDACKRFSKQEVTTPVNLHSIVARSCGTRIGGVETIVPQASDWSQPLSGKSVKKQVFDSSRCTDHSLGLNTSGLTRKKADGDLTKPHVFSYRLQLIRVLHGIWEQEPDHDNFNLHAVFRNLWKASLLTTGVLFRENGNDDIFMVLTCSPYCVSCAELEHVEDEDAVTIRNLGSMKVMEKPVLDIMKVQVAVAKPVPLASCARLGWNKQGDWMDVPTYIAQHRMLAISKSLLYALCADMKLKGHTKLDHKRRAELFMRHMKCEEEHISNILESLPEKVPRKRRKKEWQNKDYDNNVPYPQFTFQSKWDKPLFLQDYEHWNVFNTGYINHDWFRFFQEEDDEMDPGDNQDFNEDDPEDLEGQEEDEMFQEVIAEMCVLEEEDNPEAPCIYLVWK